MLPVQEAVGVTARQWRLQICGGNVREKYRGAVTLLDRLKTLVKDVSQVAAGAVCGYIDLLQPQHAIPDVFLWMISNNKRIAYHRIPARFECRPFILFYYYITGCVCGVRYM